MARSYNRVELLGNLTRDPELRYSGSGTAVCVFSVATNRGRTTEAGERVEETQYHRIVAFSKLAEQCAQFLVKGRKVFVTGRLEYRTYTNREGIEQTAAEIILDDMLLLDNKRPEAPKERTAQPLTQTNAQAQTSMSEPFDVTTTERQYQDKKYTAEDIAEEIPF